MKLGRKTVSSVVIAGVVASTFLALAPANATIRLDSDCSAYPEFWIVKASAPTQQCFYWDGTSGKTLNVGDWYEYVASYDMNLTVKWTEQYTHNVITQTQSTNGNNYPQPTPGGDPNYMLTSITYNG